MMDGEMRRRQREEERERRRVRDRERRQSMSEEQREKHLARRRRNYQLRRQRAAAINTNYNNLFIPQQLHSEHDLSCSLSDYSIHNNNNIHSPYDFKPIGSSLHFETLAYKPSLQTTFRLNHIKHLARNLITPIVPAHQFGIHQVAPELITKAHLSANGSMRKSLRLNRVKQLARSLSSVSKESLGQNQNGSIEVDAAHHTSFQTQTYANGFKCC